FLPASASSATVPLSLHDALPILVLIIHALPHRSRQECFLCVCCMQVCCCWFSRVPRSPANIIPRSQLAMLLRTGRRCRVSMIGRDRKSTRLNSSHVKISYAVFCL